MKNLFNLVSSALYVPPLSPADARLVQACRDEIRAAQTRPPLSRESIADICAQELALVLKERPDIAAHMKGLGGVHLSVEHIYSKGVTMETGIGVAYPLGGFAPLGVMNIIRISENTMSRLPPPLIREMLRHEISHAIVEKQLFQHWHSAVKDAFENKQPAFDASQKVLRLYDDKKARPGIELACDALLCKNPHMKIAYFEETAMSVGLLAGHALRKICPLNDYPSSLSRIRQLVAIINRSSPPRAPAALPPPSSP